MNAVYHLTWKRGGDRMPHLVDLLTQEGQGADHCDANQHQDQSIFRVRLARLSAVHRAHRRLPSMNGNPTKVPLRYGMVRRRPRAESVSSPRGWPSRPPPISNALSAY